MLEPFDPIGPYDMRRSDLWVAALAISFRFGSLKALIFGYTILAVAVVALVLGIIFQDFVGIGIGIWLLICLLVFPAMRSLKRSKQILITPDPEGLVIDTNYAKTVYKWHTLGRPRLVANRLIVMITGTVGLVVPQRATSPANFDRLVTLVNSTPQPTP